MFTAERQKKLGVAKSYFSEHLSRNDYYSEGEVEVGRWLGLGGARLGLGEGQPVEEKIFISLCEGLNPVTGKILTQRLIEDRRVFFDVTCSAPKSVSILAVTMNDRRIVRAHQEAARIGAKELERFAATRVRLNNAYDDRPTRNVIGAEFLHDSSRALDPQVHSHFVFFNATYDDLEARWKALEPSYIYDACRFASEVYRNELARQLIALGYRIRNRDDGKGFEIEGVSHQLITRFSKRAEQRDKVVAEMEARLGRKLTNDEVSVAVHRTRSKKLKGISAAEVRKRQLAEISEDELETLRLLVAAANGKKNLDTPAMDEKAAVAFARDHCFERASVVPEEELLQHALIQGRGHVDLQALKGLLEGDEFLRIGIEITTREILTCELELVAMLEAGRDTFPAIAANFQPSDDLGEDQREAVGHILKTPDQITGFRGVAGAGKTTALQELAKAFKTAGCSAVFVAPTTAARDVLRKDGFSGAMTLQRLLVNTKAQETFDRNTVIVVDEAGLVGLEDMHQLFSLAVKKGARVVLSGDTGQHAGVARGDALRLLEQHSLYRYGELTLIRRQLAADYRQAVSLAAEKNPKQSFDLLDSLGWVSEPARIYEEAATAFLDAIKRGRSALLVSPTWAEIDAVTALVRERLKRDGAIGDKEVPAEVFDSLSWTAAQRCDLALYRPGLRVLFREDSGEFRRFEEIEVIAAFKEGLRVRRQDGTERVFKPKAGTTFDVGERREVEIAAGDRLLLQTNRLLKDKKTGSRQLTNGEIVTVKTVGDAGIVLTDGRMLPADYREFCHGYCVTSHASQARTVDSVFLVASSVSRGAINREQFYVSISRGRRECRIFTDDKQRLRHWISRSSQRDAALDLLRDALSAEGFAAQVPAAKKIVRPVGRKLRKLRPMRGTNRKKRLSEEHVYDIACRVVNAMRQLSATVTRTIQPLLEVVTTPLMQKTKKKQRQQSDPEIN